MNDLILKLKEVEADLKSMKICASRKSEILEHLHKLKSLLSSSEDFKTNCKEHDGN